LRELISNENNLEHSKIDLASKVDFNLLDAFRIFDVEGKGWITAAEIGYGL
jgi:hypothetical protein